MLQLRPCPVCGTEGGETSVVDAMRVWAAIRAQYGVEVPESLRQRHAAAGAWTLVTCPTCDLRHFADAPQGDAEFYGLLMSGDLSYEDFRWEFGVVRDLLDSGASVVDIGCGTGAFLRGLPASLRRTGLDHNVAALTALTAADPAVDARAQDADAHADESGPFYDAVTAFQVLEHVEDPRALLRAARRLCSPSGAVYVSVPHRDRSGRIGFEVLDHPPHHLTHWRQSQLERAAEAEGLTPDGSWWEPPDLSIRMTSLTAAADRQLRMLPRPMRMQAVRVARRIADQPPVRRRMLAAGWYERRGLTGHTLLVRLRPSS